MLNEILKKWNNELNEAIISNSDFQKAKAFGKAERFLLSPKSFVIEKDKVTKWGLYPYEMDKGRGATKNKTGGLYDAIYEWLSLKKYGISWENDKERKGIAFAITRKISLFGTYRRKNPTDIYGAAIKKTLPLLEKEIVKVEINYILYAI